MHATHVTCRRMARALVMAVFALTLIGCSGITPKRMVPEAMAGPERKAAQRVRVMPITGARDSFFGGAAFPTKEQFHEALVATLEKSGLFVAVSPSDGDMDLTVSVLSIDQTGFLPLTVRLVVNYKISARGGALIWSETYDSSFSAGDFAGGTRTVNANEGAVRENLKAFVQGARERFRP